jgi:hypothetical protein
MADERNKASREAAIRRALALTAEAQDLIDGHDGPPEAGVHLDLCRQRLEEALARERG